MNHKSVLLQMLLLRINRSVAARSQLLFSQKSDKRTYLHRTQRVLFFDVSKDVLIEQHQLNNHREHFCNRKHENTIPDGDYLAFLWISVDTNAANYCSDRGGGPRLRARGKNRNTQ